jgi:Group II intron, maturase-specific domain/Reverse transcriptase (RNA-dependent DNA polymerase)
VVATSKCNKEENEREQERMQTIDAVLNAGNLTKACYEVIRNKGAAGVDNMSVKELKAYLDENRQTLKEQIRNGAYIPQPIMEMEKRGLRFVRYADDFSIHCKTRQEARTIGNSIYVFLRDKLKLPINREKSGIRRPLDFKILGYGFVPTYRKGEKGKYQLVVQQKRWKSLKAKLKEITRKTTPMSFDEQIQKLKEVGRGWINNFRFANMQEKLKELDGWLRNRLRYCIWSRNCGRKRRNESERILSGLV